MLKQLRLNLEGFEYPSDVEYLCECLLDSGYFASASEVARAWKQVSDSYCAGWLSATSYDVEDAAAMLLPYFSVCE